MISIFFKWGIWLVTTQWKTVGQNNYTLYILMAHFLLKSLEPWQTFLFSLMIYTSFSLNHACCQTVISKGQIIRLSVQLNQQMAMVYLFSSAYFYFNMVLTEHSFWTTFLHKPSRRGKRRPWCHVGEGADERCPDWCYGKERDPGKMEREGERQGTEASSLGYYWFFSELQSASALSVHSCSILPSCLSPSIHQ